MAPRKVTPGNANARNVARCVNRNMAGNPHEEDARGVKEEGDVHILQVSSGILHGGQLENPLWNSVGGSRPKSRGWRDASMERR